jgi:hypothetical protein
VGREGAGAGEGFLVGGVAIAFVHRFELGDPCSEAALLEEAQVLAGEGEGGLVDVGGDHLRELGGVEEAEGGEQVGGAAAGVVEGEARGTVEGGGFGGAAEGGGLLEHFAGEADGEGGLAGGAAEDAAAGEVGVRAGVGGEAIGHLRPQDDMSALPGACGRRARAAAGTCGCRAHAAAGRVRCGLPRKR